MVKKFVKSMVLFIGVSAICTIQVFAAPTRYKPLDAQDRSKAESDAKVRFIGDKNFVDIPDPLDPEVPILPVDPINPSDANLRITYVSPFNFNQRGLNLTTETTAFAESVKIRSVYDGKGEEQTNPLLGDPRTKDVRETVPFISTLDTRSVVGRGWELSVKRDPFVLTKDRNIELKGATITLVNSQYVQKNQPAAILPTLESSSKTKVTPVKLTENYPTPEYETFLKNLDKGFKIGSSDTVLAKASSAIDAQQGLGGFSLAFGSDLTKDKNDISEKMRVAGDVAREFASTDGVALRVPPKTIVEYSKLNENSNSGDIETDSDLFYRTVITWTLTPVEATL